MSVTTIRKGFICTFLRSLYGLRLSSLPPSVPVIVSFQHNSQPEVNVVGGTEVVPGEYPWLVALIDATITDEAFAF